MKKLVFVLAIAMIACGAYARDFVAPAGVTGPSAPWYNTKASEIKGESWDWPIDGAPIYVPYQFQDLCTFKVKMDVGYWIQINNCKSLQLNLKQVDIHTYEGSVNPEFTANAEFEVSARFDKNSVDLGGDWKKTITWTPDNIVTAGTSTKNLKLKLEKVKLDNLAGGTNCLEIGTMTISVRPHVLLQCNFNFGDTCGQ
jgi:hypothetical protein